MLKGCKHYFTMYGMLLSTINGILRKRLTQLAAQLAKSIAVTVVQKHILLHWNVEKNQTYQG